MKNSIYTFLLSVLFIFSFKQDFLFAQILAGDVLPGTSVNYTSVELRVIENDHDTITYIDLDGDGSNDVQILLAKGNPPSDASNMVIFRTPANRYSFCVEDANTQKVIHYDLGDTLCNMSSAWGTDSFYLAGCYAGWSCSHDTSAVHDKYVAYKKNSSGEIGWIKFSMSLYSQVDLIPVTFTISEMLVLYLGSAVYDTENIFHFELSPNPTLDGQFVIESDRNLSRIEIYDYSGQRIKSFKFVSGEYTLPELQGAYLIRAIDADGNHTVRKILRLRM